jgi:hypothetical protein
VTRCPIGRAKPEAAAHRDVDYNTQNSYYKTPYFTQTQLTVSQQGRGLFSTTLFYLELFVFSRFFSASQLRALMADQEYRRELNRSLISILSLSNLLNASTVNSKAPPCSPSRSFSVPTCSSKLAFVSRLRANLAKCYLAGSSADFPPDSLAGRG